MKMKKIVAAIAAAAVAATMTAVNAFAATVSFGMYPGDWGASTTIPKAEFAAIGGDVKVVLDVEQKKPLVGEANSLLKPMNICVSWDQLTWTGLTSDTAYAKGDGFICVPQGCTSIEFVVPESVWSTFVDYEGGESEQAGLAFQVCHVNIKSATLSAGAPQGEFKQITEEECKSLITTGALPGAAEEAPAEEAATEEAPAEEATTEEAPAAEETTEEAPAEEATTEEAPAVEVEAEPAPAPETSTAPAATGNAPVAAIAVVMALAGAAAVASKKN
ncbi:MAG: hypothetical protein IJ035_05075 [Oscillospiraceae bacterium]|nr:hypothetical protein [Oscillospiraceae bacterium]